MKFRREYKNRVIRIFWGGHNDNNKEFYQIWIDNIDTGVLAKNMTEAFKKAKKIIDTRIQRGVTRRKNFGGVF